MRKTPKNRKELFATISSLIVKQEWHDLPDISRYKGTGGPGNYLEDQLGADAGNMDIADTLGYELKWYTKRTHLVTLFHKEATGPDEVMLNMVRKYGRKDSRGRMSFRHTIKGKSDRFKIHNDGNRLIVKSVKGNGFVPYWSHDELVAAAGAKLRRLIMVLGERNGRRIRFLRADAYETFHLVDFIWEVMRGTIAIDFDVREARPGSTALRNHGTKFRIPSDDICRLYLKKDRIAG